MPLAHATGIGTLFVYGLGTVTIVKASGPHVNLSRSKLSRLCVCVSLIGKRDGHRSRFECPEGVENVSLRWTIVIYTSANVKLIARNTTYTYNTSCSSCILRHAIVQGGRGKAVCIWPLGQPGPGRAAQASQARPRQTNFPSQNPTWKS